MIFFADVIVVDWGIGAKDVPNLMNNYRLAGVAVALFMSRLSDSGLLDFNNLTLVEPFLCLFNELNVINLRNSEQIGHSMGAHVAGFASKKARGRVNSIVGLDAANVGDILDPRTRLDASDAEYVQIIQTEIFFIAMPAPIAHANFYPGGGMFQPYCGSDFECNHMIAIDYYAESLTATQNQFYAQRCSSMDEMQADNCTTSESDILMGGIMPNRELRGIFRVPVNSASPFALGPLS